MTNGRETVVRSTRSCCGNHDTWRRCVGSAICVRHDLAGCGGNQTRAAKVLGVSRRTLVNRLDEFNLPRPRKGR